MINGIDRMANRVASLADRGIAFPGTGGNRRALFGAFGAAGLAVSLSSTLAFAHGHRPEPVNIPGVKDGNTIRLNKGEGVFAVAPHGLLWGTDCENGQFYPGPTVLAIVSPEDGLNFTAGGNEIYFDPIDVEPAWPSEGGRDWVPYVVAVRERLTEKRMELNDQYDTNFRSFPAALNRSQTNGTVFALKDSISDTHPSRGTLVGCPRPETAAVPTASAATTGGEQQRGQVQPTVVPAGGRLLGPVELGGNCFPPARTVFSPDGDAIVDGIRYHADVRDIPSCVRVFGLWELGIDDPRTPSIVEGAHNFKINMPRGWSFVVSPTTVAIHREGGQQVNFTDGQVVIADGPLNGGVGMYEGWAGLTLTDWAQAIADWRLPIQRQQAIGRSNVNVVRFQG